MTNTNFKSLKTEASFTYVDDIIIINAKGTFVALSKACMYQGTTIDYRSGTHDFLCPNHGSEILTFHGITKPITIVATREDLLNKLVFEGKFDMSLTDYKAK